MIYILTEALNILIIIFSISFIIGHSGIMFDLSKFIWEKTHKGKEWSYQMIGKPFGCVVCMTIWTVLIYALCNGYGILYSIGIASLSSVLSIAMNQTLKIIINKFNTLWEE